MPRVALSSLIVKMIMVTYRLTCTPAYPCPLVPVPGLSSSDQA